MKRDSIAVFISTHKKKLVLLLQMTSAVIVTHVMAEDFIRPANPVMDYVPQNIGIYDTYYDNFKEPDCRACHGASTAERHHTTANALIGNCTFCHPPDIFLIERDCKICHVDGGPIGDFGFPHHKSDLADSGQCNQCHLYVEEINTVLPPEYAPSSVTPTPYSCENCHWPSGDSPHQAPLLADWEKWKGYPVPTTWPDGLNHPQPIEANGPVMSGIFGTRPYSPTEGTHHAINGEAYPKCNNCHGSISGGSYSWDPTNPYLIRYCENCHSVNKLHQIKEHVRDNDIYRVGGQENTVVTANEKCIACHNYILLQLPSLPADVPVADRLEPDFGPPGIIVKIIPASDICFKEDPNGGLCSFGQKMNGDAVLMAQEDSDGNLYWVDVPIYSWSEHLIQIKIPENVFQPGKTFVKVHKERIGTSPFEVFTLRENPVISSLSPAIGNWYQNVDIAGAGFGVQREQVYNNGYGYSTYVELSQSNMKYRVTRYRAKTLWEPDRLPIKVKDFLNINTGNPVSEQDLYIGCWNVRIITDYFKDDGDGKYNYHLRGLDTPYNPCGKGSGDELLYRDISDSLCFTVIRDVYIDRIQPDPVPYNDVATIYGSNFGSTQGTSVVRIWNNQKTSFVIAQTIFWSTTKIKFKVPKFGTALSIYPKEKFIQIKVPGKPGSNHCLIKIIKP